MIYATPERWADMYVEDVLELNSTVALLVELANIEGQIIGVKVLYKLNCLSESDLKRVFRDSLDVINGVNESSYFTLSPLCADLSAHIRELCKI